MSERPEPMPALFFGHGSPMNALGGEYAQAWRAIGTSVPRPKVILCVSAHWFVPYTAVTAMASPRTIHDFYGFPKALFDVRYPAPGDTWLADRLIDLLQATEVRADKDWGLDHGTWSVLRNAFPLADIPVVQLSIDRTADAAFHYQLAQRLTALREEGVLIVGSGGVVHNLGRMQWHEAAEPFDWAIRFNDWVKESILASRHEELMAYQSLSNDALLSVPTPEHYLPLLYVLATRRPGDTVQFFTDRIELGSISMLGVRLG